MKRFFLLALVLCSTVSWAQDVRLPELPKNRTRYIDYREKENGYWTSVSAGGTTTFLFHRKNMQSVGAEWINGYRFNEFLRVGVGIGLQYYINNDNLRRSDIPWSFPLFADVRGNIISQQDRSAVPYWSFDIGGEIRGGMYLAPSIGYRFGCHRSSFTLSLGFIYRQLDTWKKDKESIGGISLKVGYEF